MQRINYSAPALDTLINNASILLSSYQQRRPGSNNQDRLRLIKELETIHQRISALRATSSSATNYTDAALQKVSVGAWIYALECLNGEYFSGDASTKKGYLYNSGSELCGLISNALSVNSSNVLDDQSRLIYLAEFYQFAGDNLDIDNLNFENKIEQAMSNVLGRMMKSVNTLMHAIPTEEILYDKFENLYEDYKAKRLIRQSYFAPKVDEDRPFCAQLGQVVAGLLKSENKSVDSRQIDRSYKILLGLLIYMMRTIPGERSELFKICKSILNGGVDTLSPNVQYDCLMTLKTYLQDNTVIQQITNDSKKIFGKENRLVNLDTKLDMVRVKLDQQLHELCPPQLHSMVGAKVLGTAAALTLYPVGFGVGSVLGAVGSGAESQANVRLKMFVTRWFNTNVHTILGVNNAGYIMATPVVTAVYQTMAGNLIGAMFALSGGLLMGGIGYLVVDVMLRNLYSYVVQNAKGDYRDPLYAGNFNLELLRCLENLPDSVLSGKKKDKISNVVGHAHRLMLYSDSNQNTSGIKSDNEEIQLLNQAP